MDILFFFLSISLLHLCHLINNKIPATFPCFHLTNFKKVPSYTPVVFETLEYSHLCQHRVVISKHLNSMKQNYILKTSFLRLLLILTRYAIQIVINELLNCQTGLNYPKLKYFKDRFCG